MNDSGYDYSHIKTRNQFIEAAFELAFGDNAINRDFDYNEVLCELHKFSDDALICSEELEELQND